MRDEPLHLLRKTPQVVRAHQVHAMPHRASRGRSQSSNGAQGKGSGRETERGRSEALPAQEPTPTLWGTYKSRTCLQAHSDVERRVQVTLWAGTGPTYASRHQARDREPLQHAELAEAPSESGKRRGSVKSPPRFGRCFTRAPVMAFAQQRKRPQRPAPLKPTSVEGFGGRGRRSPHNNSPATKRFQRARPVKCGRDCCQLRSSPRWS